MRSPLCGNLLARLGAWDRAHAAKAGVVEGIVVNFFLLVVIVLLFVKCVLFRFNLPTVKKLFAGAMPDKREFRKQPSYPAPVATTSRGYAPLDAERVSGMRRL